MRFSVFIFLLFSTLLDAQTVTKVCASNESESFVTIDSIRYCIMRTTGNNYEAVIWDNKDVPEEVFLKRYIYYNGEYIPCSMKPGAFRNCKNLKRVHTEIPVSAEGFKGCSNLDSIYIDLRGGKGNSQHDIKQNAFDGCEKLRSIRLSPSKKDGYIVNIKISCEFPSHVNIFLDDLDANFLQDTFIDFDMLSISGKNLYKYSWSYYQSHWPVYNFFINNTPLKDYILTSPYKEGKLGDGFNLNSITVPSDFQCDYGPYEPWKSETLESIHLTARRINVDCSESIDRRKYRYTYIFLYCCDTLVFRNIVEGTGCPNTIIIGENVKELGPFQFRGNENTHLVKDIYVYGNYPPSIKNTIAGGGFSDITYLYGTLHVPKGMKNKYLNSDWGKFHNIIDDITGIKKVTTMENDSHSTQNNYYDLQGRPVNNPVKGQLYIVNGKKILAK